jgi:glycosyltransferase involved in cell wall biosynthesis
VQVVRELGSGGIERDVAKFALRIDRSRFQCFVAAYQPHGIRAEDLRQAGVPIIHLDVPSLKSPRALGSALRFAAFIRSKRIQVVHAWDASIAFAGPVAQAMRVPLVLAGTLGSRKLLDPNSQQRLKWADRFVDAMVVNCEAMREHLVHDCAFPPDRIELCYNGVEPTEFYPGATDRPPELPADAFVIGTVCVLRWEKNLPLLQEAFSRVCALVPAARLLIVGSGPELPKLQANAARLDITQQSIFVPARRSVAPFLRAIDIFVSSSISEAFSNSLLEAMACGCAPVGSRVGGTPELIADGERGFLFESENVDDLSGKLKLLMTDSQLRSRFSGNAAAFASGQLSMERHTARLSEIYENHLRAHGVLAAA